MLSQRYIERIVTLCFLLLAAAGIWHFVRFRSSFDLVPALPQPDPRMEQQEVTRKTIIGEHFQRFAESQPQENAGSWPGFRGPNRDNIAKDSPPLRTDWGAVGPKVLWRQELGEGYAAPAVAYGLVYVLDYLEEAEQDALRCFELLTGQEVWRRYYENPVRRNHGKSRTVCAVSDGTVVSVGPKAHVMTADAFSGDLLWTCDMLAEYDGELPQWYAGQCPLIDQGAVILAPAGKDALLQARDLHSGKVLWQTANSPGLKMSHSSIVPMVLQGIRQYVYCGLGGVVGVAEDGELLWHTAAWRPPVWAPSPVQISNQEIFLTAGYGAGSAVLQVTLADGKWETSLKSAWKPSQGPACEQQTPVFYKGLLFTIQPKDAGSRRAQLVAADPARLPEILAGSGREERFGLGPYLIADQKIWIVDDQGVLSVFEFAGQDFRKLAAHRVLPGFDAWGPLALADGLMILRDATSMACVDLR